MRLRIGIMIPDIKSSKLNISSSYLSHLFKKELNTTLTDYVTEKRIKQTLMLLTTTKLSVQTICSHVGIDDSNYFNKIFKNKIGYTPTEYRKQFQLVTTSGT